MNEEIISKKDLLEITDISYGQLYRWKRKKLIPEEWFIKKATFTGQETFFPKDKILERIDKIKNMKDDLSLDEMSKIFTPDFDKIHLTKNEIIKNQISKEITINIYLSMYGEKRSFSFEEILNMIIMENMVQSGEVNIKECKTITDIIIKNNLKNKDYDIVLLRKFGIAIPILLSSAEEIFTDDETKIIKKINLHECIEDLKFKISNIDK